MEKSWLKKFQRRVKQTLRKMKHVEATNDFDETSQQYKLVSLNLINLGGKGRKGIKAPPVHGTALYYVYQYGDEVKLLHPFLLQTHTLSRRTFDKSIIDIWWPNVGAAKDPNVRNIWGGYCNRFTVADAMLQKMKDFTKREKLFKQKVVREAIADLKGIPIEQVPQYKQPVKLDKLKLWREQQLNAEYRQRAINDFSKHFNEGENKVSDKKKKKKSAESSDAPSSVSSASSSVSSAASDDNDKKKKKGKKEKPAKKSTKKGGKEKASKDGQVKAPRGAKTAKAIAIQMMMKKKGKKISLEDICKVVQKAKGLSKPFPEKKLSSKAKEIEKWAKKSGLSFKHSSSGMQLR